MLKRVFFDMDGTVARFYSEAGCVENYAQPGFFSRLEPYRSMLTLIRMLSEHAGEVVVYGLSVVPNEVAAKEKRVWLKTQLMGAADPRLLVLPRGDSKPGFVKRLFELESLSDSDILIDDYSSNLVSWSAAGGTGIKALNELNGRGWNGTNYNGPTLDVQGDPGRMYLDICRMLCVKPKRFDVFAS